MNLGAQTELQLLLYSVRAVRMAEGDQGPEAFRNAQLGS